ncbi:hypothetical protein [Fluviicola taffensis]|uniref:hypothetical protein n=1 Tax=Fluviicola taffensis TaxID=191579 RepID=UPI003138316B
MTGFGLLLLLVGVIAVFVGIVMVCFESTQKPGLIVLLSGFASIIIGFSVCSYFPIRIH